MRKFLILRPIFRKVMIGIFSSDLAVNNLLMEDGYNLLQEDGSLIVL
jgi:hypothetical protein